MHTFHRHRNSAYVACSVVVLETMVLVSRPNLPVLVWSWTVRSWSWYWSLCLLTTGLGLAFKQDQDLINFYCAISSTKLWLLYITEKLRLVCCWKCCDAVRGCSASSLCPGQRFNGSTVPVLTWCTLLSTSCSHGTVFVCTSDICAGWKGVQPRWPIYEATSCQTGRICVILPCVLEVQQALGLLECDCMDMGHCTNWGVDVASD